jgi:hypothetical protein
MLVELQLKMQPQRLIQLGHDRGGKLPERWAEASHRDRMHLLGLRLRVNRQPAHLGAEEHLERKDLCDVARDGNDRDDTAPEPFGDDVGAIVAHDHRRPTLARLASPHRIEIVAQGGSVGRVGLEPTTDGL